MSIEIGYKKVPESSNKLRESFGGLTTASLINTVEAPLDLVRDVVINPKISEFLSKEWVGFFNEDWMAANILITAPRDHLGVDILTISEFGRSNPTGYCRIPYANKFVGGVVYGKGGGISGSKWLEGISANESHTPWGYYGDKDADWEIKESNLLLNSGLRTSLPLGYVIFDYDKLCDFVHNTWNYNAFLAKRHVANIRKVVANGDSPSYLYRLGGVCERVFRPLDRNRDRVSLIRGFRLHKKELELFPKFYDENLTFTTRKSAEEVINTLSRGERGKKAKIDQTIDLLSGIFVRELNIIKYSNFKHLWGIFPQTKDTDLALFKTDWEESREINGSFTASVYNQTVLAERFLDKLIATELVEHDEGNKYKILMLDRIRSVSN